MSTFLCTSRRVCPLLRDAIVEAALSFFHHHEQASNSLHHEMMSKWVNVLLPYGQSALSEQQEAQAELDDEKAKVQRDCEDIILSVL